MNYGNKDRLTYVSKLAGIEPYGIVKAKRVTTNITLTTNDYFVSCENSSTATIKLPLLPEIGRMIILARNGGNIVVDGNGKSLRYGTISAQSTTLKEPGGCVCVYNGIHWSFMCFAAA